MSFNLTMSDKIFGFHGEECRNNTILNFKKLLVSFSFCSIYLKQCKLRLIDQIIVFPSI